MSSPYQPDGNRCSAKCEQYGLGGPGVCKITNQFTMGLDCSNPPLCLPWVNEQREDRWEKRKNDPATHLACIEGGIRLTCGGSGYTCEPTDAEHALLECAHEILTKKDEQIGRLAFEKDWFKQRVKALEEAYDVAVNEASLMTGYLFARHPETVADLRNEGVAFPTEEDIESLRQAGLDMIAKFKADRETDG